MVFFKIFFVDLLFVGGKNLEIVSAFVCNSWSEKLHLVLCDNQILLDHANTPSSCISQSRYLFLSFQSLISRLPAYLSIQFVRFFYKEKEKINAKILKVRNNIFYVLFDIRAGVRYRI